MIKRILVALDPDSDSEVAIQYAIAIAKETGARITGLAVVDTQNIKVSSRGGGIGSMYYADKLRENLTQETRQEARRLINAFEKAVEGSGVRHLEVVEEGVPFERIVEDMKYHDLLVMGCDPHFFYGHPKMRTDTLAGVFHHTVGPTIVVPKAFRPVHKVLYATNGQNSSSRALRRFIELSPFGSDLEIDVIFVHEKENRVDAEFHLQLTKDYLADHGFTARVWGTSGPDKAREILEKAEEVGSDLIVAGSTTDKGITGYHMSKTTDRLTENHKIAVFIEH
jgi:nucleotide-binding universal stress UspA family protein